MNRVVLYAALLCTILLSGTLFGQDDTVKMLENEVESLLKAEISSKTDHVAKAKIYLQLGDLLGSKYCYAGAVEYYAKAFEASVQGEDVTSACSALAAKAKSEFMMAQYDRSIASYQKALSMAGSIKDTNSTIRILNSISAVMLYSANHTLSAEQLMASGMEASGICVEQLTALCANSAALHKELGKNEGELLYLAGDEKIRDSLNKTGEEFLADFNSLKTKLAQAALLNKRMAQREVCILGFFALLCLLFAGSGVYLYRKMKIQQQELALENKKSGERVTTLSSILERKVAGFKRFLDAASYKRERPEEFLVAFKRYIHIENGRLPDAFADIIDIANLYHHGVINRLRLEYPSLNDEELYMCALIVLDFPMGSIKFIYNHASEDSMYNKRSRLKKKLGLAPDERPEKFIRERMLLPIASC